MESKSTQTSRAAPLASLMKLSEKDKADWSAAELGEILRHQLSAPLEYDLSTIAPGGKGAVTQSLASITLGPRPRSFGDLIAHPHPPLDLLNLMKDFARGGRDDGTLPAEVGTILYYAAIALALLRQQTRITKLDDGSLRNGLAWCEGMPWIEPGLKQIFIEAKEKLAQ